MVLGAGVTFRETFLYLLGGLGWYQDFQNKCKGQLCSVQKRKNKSCSFSIGFALSMQEDIFF